MSVFVEYDQWSRTGNRMFQYAFGRILSHTRGDVLYSSGIPEFNIPANLIDTAISPIYTKQYGNNNVKWEELLCIERDVVINSFLQRADYYTPYREDLKKCFNIQDIPPVDDDVLTVHIRETDYKDIGVFLGYEAYREIINASGFSKITIVTDNSRCECVRRLLQEGCELSSTGYVDKFSHSLDQRGKADFMSLLTCSNLLLSQSSFSWWAGFLGNHNKLIFPYKLKSGMWKSNPTGDDIDLYYDYGKSVKYTI